MIIKIGKNTFDINVPAALISLSGKPLIYVDADSALVFRGTPQIGAEHVGYGWGKTITIKSLDMRPAYGVWLDSDGILYVDNTVGNIDIKRGEK